MRTNIDLDEALLAKAIEVSGARTKREAVNLGLEALIRLSRKKDLLDLVGQIDIEPGYDHKQTRHTRHDALTCIV